MTRATAWHCDAPDCDAHTDPIMGEHPPFGWRICLCGEGGHAAPKREWTKDFCSWECVLRYAATLPPPMVVTPDDEATP